MPDEEKAILIDFNDPLQLGQILGKCEDCGMFLYENHPHTCPWDIEKGREDAR